MPDYLKFLVADNLASQTLTEGTPWTFDPPEADFKRVTAMPKTKRREWMLNLKTKWQVYTAIAGFNAKGRIKGENPARLIYGLVMDYDVVQSTDYVVKLLEQIPEKYRPNFVETSLSGKKRLIWIFERPVMAHSIAYAQAFNEQCVKVMGLATLLPGFDASSVKPTQLWTNGVIWEPYKEEPLAVAITLGIEMQVSERSELFGVSEVPLDIVGPEVEVRYPGRWPGGAAEFKLGAKGVRFWDPKADNKTGCQVCPDGMKCFTGPKPFVPWEEIFTRAWVEEKKVLHLGKASEKFIYDGKTFFEKSGLLWKTVQEHHVLMRLKESGLAGSVKKGQTISDAERVLNHITQQNRVDIAGPFINRPPGLQKFRGQSILNTASLDLIYPVEGDYSYIEEITRGLFGDQADVVMAWSQRALNNFMDYESHRGQALFIAGPAGCGKTLYTMRILGPMFGNRICNPMQNIMSKTDFSEDVLNASLLAMNDEEAPVGAERQKYLQKMKSFVVNPDHKFHAKFRLAFNVEWCGRIVVTLNNDAASCAQLPEINENTFDKFMFLRAYMPKTPWPNYKELEQKIQIGLPAWIYYLRNIYVPPASVVDPKDQRIYVKSYFDPMLLAYSQHQSPAHNFKEVIQHWMSIAADSLGEWIGTPTRLLADLCVYGDTQDLARKLTQRQVAESLTTLSRLAGSGVYVEDPSAHTFRINRSELLKQHEQAA